MIKAYSLPLLAGVRTVKRRWRFGAGLGCLVALLGALVSARAADPLIPDQVQGRQIYHTGTSPWGEPISAILGGQRSLLDAAILPCVSCHGPEGRGRPEGSVTPSDITWSALTRPYPISRPDGRSHPPYDRRTLVRAFTLGVDPAGNRLHAAMPRFRMSQRDAEALAAYIEQLSWDLDPGLSEQRVLVGTLLPAERPDAGRGRAVEAVLRARFEEINAEGGIYGRRLELRVAHSAPGADAWRQALGALLRAEPVFALVAPFSAGAARELAALTDALGLPVIGPITQTPGPEGPGRTFYLLSGLDQQVRVLWDFAAGRQRTRNAAVLGAGSPEMAATVAALRDQAQRWSLPEPVQFEMSGTGFGERALAQLCAYDAVFFLGTSAAAAALIDLCAASGDTPDLLVPGPLAGPLLERPSPQVFLSWPNLPSALSPSAERRWQAFVARHHLTLAHHVTPQLALVATEIFIEALRRCGRALSRACLVASLEGLYGFTTHLLPPLSYGVNRRIGALGAYVVQIDPDTGLVLRAAWIEPR
jgi:ABC-type branched-subunit amino acid transport system substrate-binding protein